MTIASDFVSTTIKGLSRLLCKIDAEQLSQVPKHGPLILVANHVNFLDVPLIYTHLRPRPVTGFVKVETWDNPAMAALFNLFETIPIRRGEADVSAMRKALSALKERQIVAVAPEGTRSGDGVLRRGYPGVVVLAQHSGAPILPVAYYGGEHLRNNLRRMRRTDFHIKVGKLFTIDAGGEQVTRAVRQRIVDEIMYQIAALLPSSYRGYYTDLNQASTHYLRFRE